MTPIFLRSRSLNFIALNASVLQQNNDYASVVDRFCSKFWLAGLKLFPRHVYV